MALLQHLGIQRHFSPSYANGAKGSWMGCPLFEYDHEASRFGVRAGQRRVREEENASDVTNSLNVLGYS